MTLCFEKLDEQELNVALRDLSCHESLDVKELFANYKKEENEILLNSENSSAKIMSAVFLKNDDHQEIQSIIRHQKPSCKSFQKIKNILRDGSKGIFQGKVYVSKEAQKTDFGFK